MSFGQRVRERRKQLGMSQAELAKKLGVSLSAVSNYENGQNAVKEEVLFKLFRALDIDPNYLYQDSFSGKAFVCSAEEQSLVRKYRELRIHGRQALHAMADTLGGYQAEMEEEITVGEIRQIPLYRNPAAAGYAAPVFGEDFDYISVTGEVPQGAEYAVRIQGDSMEPYIRHGSIAYVNRDPLASGDVGIFCVDGDMFCKQYVRDKLGIIYLLSLNRRRADADVVLPRSSGRSLVCLGRVLLPSRPPVVR